MYSVIKITKILDIKYQMKKKTLMKIRSYSANLSKKEVIVLTDSKGVTKTERKIH